MTNKQEGGANERLSTTTKTMEIETTTTNSLCSDLNSTIQFDHSNLNSSIEFNLVALALDTNPSTVKHTIPHV
jgi:hypothetical protein